MEKEVKREKGKQKDEGKRNKLCFRMQKKKAVQQESPEIMTIIFNKFVGEKFFTCIT